MLHRAEAEAEETAGQYKCSPGVDAVVVGLGTRLGTRGTVAGRSCVPVLLGGMP